jgi:hypothetical protein
VGSELIRIPYYSAISREEIGKAKIRPQRCNSPLGGVEHAVPDGFRVRIAKKEQNSRSSPVVLRKKALALKGDGSVFRIQLVNWI